MKITGDCFEIIDKAERYLLTSFMTIYDEDNLEGYIDENNLYSLVEGLLDKIKKLKKDKEEIEKDRDENWKPISYAEQVGISDRDFI